MGKKIKTNIIHVGSNPENNHGSISDPIYKNSTLIFKNYSSFVESKKNKFEVPYYGRFGNFTTKNFENVISKLYKSEKAVVTSSGLSAITITFLSLLSKGDEILVIENCYEPVANFCKFVLSKFDISTRFYNPNETNLKSIITKKTKLIYIESPGSLNFEVQDLNEIVSIAKKKNIITIMDNTWSTFLGCNPIKFGIDIVIESLTKYFSGHSDNFCGAIACSSKYFLLIKQTAVRLGDFVSPESCFFASRGLKTLPVRMKNHELNAEKVYEFLKKHHLVEKIYYLPDEKNNHNKLWKKYHTLNNGLISFSIKKINKCNHFVDNLKLFKIGFSWGGYESLILPLDKLKPAINIKKNPNLWFRIHVGLENNIDLIEDLDKALIRYEKN